MRRFLISLIVLIAFVLAGTILSQRSYAKGPPEGFPALNSRVELSVFCMVPSPGAVFGGAFCLPRQVRGYIEFIRDCHDDGGQFDITGIFFGCMPP